MGLVKQKPVSEFRPVTYDDPIAAKIQQRRYQILVHSLLYYELDSSLVSDHTWARWGEELVELQKNNPESSKKVIFYEAFKNFDASTGFDLPFRDEQIVNIAYRLLMSRESNAESQDALAKLKYQVQRTPAEIDRYLAQSRKAVSAVQRKEEKASAKSNQKPRKGLFSLPRG